MAIPPHERAGMCVMVVPTIDGINFGCVTHWLFMCYNGCEFCGSVIFKQIKGVHCILPTMN